MWYDKRWMRLSFYVGVMLVAVGLGLAKINDEYRLAGALLMCLGAALIVYGFMGIMINNMVEEEFRRKKRRPSSQQR